MFKPATYNEKKIQLELTNILTSCHLLSCECDEPTFHSTKLILQQLSRELTQDQKNQLKKCLGDSTEDNGRVIAEDDFGEDLETLFAEDFTEEKQG